MSHARAMISFAACQSWQECDLASHESASCSLAPARFRTGNGYISAASHNGAARHLRKAAPQPLRAPDRCRPRKFRRTACVIGFQHWRKIRSVLIRDTVAPIGTHKASQRCPARKTRR